MSIDQRYLKWMLKKSSPKRAEPAVDTLKENQSNKVNCNVYTLLTHLKSCSMKKDLQWGKTIHEKTLESQHHSNMYVLKALIRMYAKCGSMVDARCIFDSIKKPDVACSNALLLGYAENGEGLATLEMFSRMKDCGYQPNSVTYIAALKACTSLAGRRDGSGQSEWLKRGREIHSEICCETGIFVQSTLIDMYSKCGSMVDAQRVFDSIQTPDVVCWNALLMGYADDGDGLATLKMLPRMKDCGCVPNSVTYIAALKACAALAGKRAGGGQAEWLKRGQQIHSAVSCDWGLFVQSTLIDMYGKCGSMADARDVFDEIWKPNVVCWNALLLGYVENGDGISTLELFSRMKAGVCAPNSVTYIAALKACTSLAGKQDSGGHGECLIWGKEIHSEIGSNLNILVQNTLIDMYTKCGSMVDARRVFDSIEAPSVVSWTALLLGYAENGDGYATLELFSMMKSRGCAPNAVTYIAALKACTFLAGKTGGHRWLKQGRDIHSEIGSDLDIFVQNTLIDMYFKCGSIVNGRCVFDSIQNPNVVSWNALLLGYVENGEEMTTLELFSKMKSCGCVPNSVTYGAVLKACGMMGSLALGRKFHSVINEFSAHVVTCLVDFYSKCGSIVEAREVFDAHLGSRNVSTWTALLTGYGSFGDTVSVFKLFDAMQDQGFQPDAVTFVCILSCCSHAGLVDKAREYFKAMPIQYGITPTVMHYTCMVDVLGRANQLNEAVALLRKMPCTPDVVTWMTLLGACRKWKDVEIGRYAFESVVEIDKRNATAYVLIADIYGSMGMWEEQLRVSEARINLGVWKLLGQAYVVDEVGNMVKFVDGEVNVENNLEKLLDDLKKRGYVPESYNFSDAETDECGHSERRAVVYGILKTPSSEPVWAFKNKRMCDSCHGSTKRISELSGRVIIVRDPSRFHVMVNGSCSCGEYW